MNNALSLFVSECSERLDRLESQLLALEQGGGEREGFDAMLREAHSIKGNAGVVQLGEIEWFAHILENVLERLREGKLPVDGGLVSILLASVDHLRFLVGLSSLPESSNVDFANEERTRLIGLLVPYIEEESLQLPAVRRAVAVSPRFWTLTLRFAPNVLTQGLDPIYFLQHLNTIGNIVRLKTFLEDLPPLSGYIPEYCYLHFELELDTVADRQQVEDIFTLVRDSCELHLTPPESKLQDYISLIRSLPAEDLHVGEMLVRVGALTADELADSLRNQRHFDQTLGSDYDIGNLLVQKGLVERDVIDAVLARQRDVRNTLVQDHRMLRVPAESLAELGDLLVLIHHGLGRLAREYGGGAESLSARQIPALIAQTERAIEISHQIQRIQLTEVFQRLHRLIRDAAQELGKQADLIVSGGELEVDRVVGEGLAEPLVHLVRNALDHGIELPALRLASGKPTRGVICLDAWEDKDMLVLSVSDDGAGIDRGRIVQIALDRGLMQVDARVEDSDLFSLLFSPGFTTADHVTRISGRGVGLDVVKTCIERLGGSISIRSLPARGARFELRLPLRKGESLDLSSLMGQRNEHSAASF
jgi:two-component system chemotaxis sensor kinase CheA